MSIYVCIDGMCYTMYVEYKGLVNCDQEIKFARRLRAEILCSIRASNKREEDIKYSRVAKGV